MDLKKVTTVEEDDSCAQFVLTKPPILPTIENDLRQYLECPERLPIHQIDRCQVYWPRQLNIPGLLSFDLAPCSTTLKFDRDPITGQIGELKEVLLKGVGETAKNSMSMNRAPAPLDEGVRGNTSNIPFWPGGFDEPPVLNKANLENIDFETNLRTLAKGFSCGIEFQSDNCTPKNKTASIPNLTVSDSNNSNHSQVNKVNLMAIINEEESRLGLSIMQDASTKSSEESSKNITSSVIEDDEILSKISIPEEDSNFILNISNHNPVISAEWAEQLNVSDPVPDFEQKIPDPALKFDYELDIFQKQAIIKLEENCNVFVAAHTSAGKTTVAEYAIALSQKHMTRVIYTSPIKALSNQKYRDFRKKFESVGLLTGDLQINQTAACLIMTTEILQSMLYCASDVLRDLEFVIFDEVHYINNEDRGHVWEEILILLPQTVTIVMLSATVPNPIKFANWVGSIKKRKTFVISTPKRPVPLQHYLYVNDPGSKKDNGGEKFLILNNQQEFLVGGWYQATQRSKENAKKEEEKRLKAAKYSGNTGGPKKNALLNANRKLWRSLVNHLNTNDMMPVVVFTLSRKRCDLNANMLINNCNIDLTTADEKSMIAKFFEKNIKTLKGTDRTLPQVKTMEMFLKKGIGVHHSGILPILKEVVEMLFQSGAVKLLFATETFAMGVNMPARTVVFDSIIKYDGNEFRDLHPTEYIQMAGRAGRRGHDKTGTVIIKCKDDTVPKIETLKKMMCGEPQTLQSKFKVTYRMVLNLRRVNESVSVESMLRKSFREIDKFKREHLVKSEIESITNNLSTFPEFTAQQKRLSEFYNLAVDYLRQLEKVMPSILSSKKAIKSMSEGRVLLVSCGKHHKKLGLLLKVSKSTNCSSQYSVLVLSSADTPPIKNSDSDLENPSKSVKNELWYDMIGLTKKDIYLPNEKSSHEVLTLSPQHILKITEQIIQTDCNLIIKDWEKRQIARFKNDPPGATCQSAIQMLLALSLEVSSNPEILSFIDISPTSIDTKKRLRNSEDIHSSSVEIKHLNQLKEKIDSLINMEISDIEEQFFIVFNYKELESRRNGLQVQLSDEGLALYPDYQNMVTLLKKLGYIEVDERVALKGKVALQMGTNELIITELILKDVLTRLQPAEIAALLSGIIFQQRTDNNPLEDLKKDLKDRCEVITEIHENLQELERTYFLQTLQPLNFGLVRVVYEWAKGKPFAEIMELIDVQEGIIVRCIQQLDETLRDVKNAAIVIGDPVLRQKMEEASKAIKRDIVFAASLYTQET
ncbi:superkiller complex protein 2 [Prorops nasuta]|uniref:superkiller complex protein 2 n=1 Tax=Prorops nasuta TaxID=863751 RepID=UPI0034CEB88D